ncbi:glyoxalase [Streptomyces sp. CoH27]|uniref:glyoxalase n=1 Tax=Streptomyces sp. CoH27 TaxID=2875763 RepID=UPI001CD3C262|nr:glyoxalase [Streptomyces sp. CoH27]
MKKSKATVRLLPALLLVAGIGGFAAPSSAESRNAAAVLSDATTAVGPQYDTTHVYVTPGAMDAFVTCWEATFGGTNTAKVVTQVTPTPSTTASELVLSPVGALSVFDFRTPVPYPFGAERTGWLMSDFDKGVRLARASGAALVVAPFDDPIGRDAVVQFPGGVNAQLYWHTKAPSYAPLKTVPENRIYLTRDSARAFLTSYLRFTGGRIVSDDQAADGGQIGTLDETYRRITISSHFGDTVVSVTDGHLPYPFGRETTGYAVKDLTSTLHRAEVAGAKVLWGPNTSQGRTSAMVQFPGGYVAELHQGDDR